MTGVVVVTKGFNFTKSEYCPFGTVDALVSISCCRHEFREIRGIIRYILRPINTRRVLLLL